MSYLWDAGRLSPCCSPPCTATPGATSLVSFIPPRARPCSIWPPASVFRSLRWNSQPLPRRSKPARLSKSCWCWTGQDGIAARMFACRSRCSWLGAFPCCSSPRSSTPPPASRGGHGTSTTDEDRDDSAGHKEAGELCHEARGRIPTNDIGRPLARQSSSCACSKARSRAGSAQQPLARLVARLLYSGWSREYAGIDSWA